jgi:ribosomal subunit interface protein
MVILLAGRGGTSVAPSLQRRIESKIAKMQRLLPKLIEARVVLSTERHQRLAEVTLRAKGTTFHVEVAATDFHAAVDQALAGLTAQIRKKKERVTARKPRRSAIRPESPAASGGPGEIEDEAPPVVRRRTSAKPMSLEEALDQLRLQREGLLVFRNARTRSVNVLQRRPNGTVELVEPAG